MEFNCIVAEWYTSSQTLQQEIYVLICFCRFRTQCGGFNMCILFLGTNVMYIDSLC